ncbi:MAG TPA: ABC transporter permease [Jiangellaceae bacterium]
MRTWRPALRIARRTVRRNLGRSLLVAILVAIPVAAGTMVDVLYRTQTDSERTAYEAMGTADAIIEATGFDDLGAEYFPSVTSVSFPADAPTPDAATIDPEPLAEALPPGSRLVAPPVIYWDQRIADGERNVRVELAVVAMDDPLTERWTRVDDGRHPLSADEALVSRALAERLDLLDARGYLRPGAELTMRDGPTVAITGLNVDPFALGSQTLVAAPESALADYARSSGSGAGTSGASGVPPSDAWQVGSMYGGPARLVDLPDGAAGPDAVSWSVLAEQGIRLVPRDAAAHPERYEPAMFRSSPTDLRFVAMAVLVAGLGLLEVVLLAGAAFAVGARRQVHDLGLMSANGATARQIRQTVLAQGLVLGAMGAALGIAVGAALTVAAKPVWERVLGELLEDWRFGAGEIALTAAVGLMSGLAAAIVPAVGAARMKPVDALAQRFRTTRIATRLPVVGVALFVIGAGGALVASRVAAGELDEYARTLEAAAGTGRSIVAPSTEIFIAMQLAGAIVAVAGVVVILPGLVSMVARLGRRLPLSARFAVRDAARHRHRTAPTLAAITIVVAGSVGLAFVLAGAERANLLRYVPQLPEAVMQVQLTEPDTDPEVTADALRRATDVVAGALPEADARPDRAVTVPAVPGEASYASQIWLDSWSAMSCQQDCGSEYSISGGLSLADPGVIELAAGAPPDDAMLQALADGRVVVFDPALVDDNGAVVVQAWDDNGELSEDVRIPAYVATRDLAYGSLPAAFVAEDVVAEHGWTAEISSVYVAHADATRDQIDAAIDAAEKAGAGVSYEPPDESGPGPEALALVAGAALVTLVGVGIAVALSAVEGRADLATLAAVGAPPRRRRALAGAQALLVGGLGTLLGVALGTYFAFLLWPAVGAPQFIVPWGNLLLTGLAVPALAVAVAVIFTPSRLPVVRRLA